MMRRGFTIIELLVASMLLGMLVTILTMIFNQSSIAWRIGMNSVSDLGDARYTIGVVRDISDNAFVYDGSGYRSIGPWSRDGQLRNRACCKTQGSGLNGADASDVEYFTKLFFDLQSPTPTSSSMTPSELRSKSVGRGSGNQGYQSLYVNVKSGGPKNDIEDYQAIWSAPDDPQEW